MIGDWLGNAAQAGLLTVDREPLDFRAVYRLPGRTRFIDVVADD